MPMDDKFSHAMDALSGLAYQFGPFFFAVLFTLVITRSAKRWYSEVDGKKDPGEKAAYQNLLPRLLDIRNALVRHLGRMVG
jgi:hypothetical protein